MVENPKIYVPTCIKCPRGGRPHRNFVKMFDAGKTKMIGLPYGKKTMIDMLSRFHLIPECYGQTDRQNCYISIVRSMLMHDKNRYIQLAITTSD